MKKQSGTTFPAVHSWHEMTVSSVLSQLQTSPQGLRPEEISNRLKTYGKNELKEGKKRTALIIFLGQFTDFMILVLVIATVISALMGDVENSLAILAILIINAVIGFIQEFRAEKAMAALKAMSAPFAEVIREGKTSVIPASGLVPGDIVILEAGCIVPADLRLIELAHLKIDESVLTGESVPVEKMTEPVHKKDGSLGDRHNMAYKGTVVTYGRAKGVVVATGMNTEFGKIAQLLGKSGDLKTPLQKRLANFGKKISIFALIICAVVFVTGLIRGENLLLIFMTSVSLAVAAIPEALPAVVTISLALGTQRMVRKNALVRRLPAVETLGSVTYICTDKTGTLTQNKMRVEEFYCDHAVHKEAKSGPAWQEFLKAMALSNDAHSDAAGKIVGDPTEVALYIAAKEGGVDKKKEEPVHQRVAEIPFDAKRKCMTTIHKTSDGSYISFTKGALEVMLLKSVRMLSHSGVVQIPSDEIVKVTERMASEGLRVLALSMKKWETLPEKITHETVEQELTLLGFVGMRDPHREEVPEAVRMCKEAGIVPVMITGDHPSTARAIARHVGILDGGELMTGRELAEISEKDYEKKVEHIRVYARVNPEEKLKIVSALKARGEIVAMTGDGVNDAPALKQADIGIAMGIQGTDVAKEASAMILLDDNFVTIVKAVREGRRIYDNLRKFIRYILTTNSSEIWTIFLAPFLGLPIPFLPIQILWINLLSDGLPGLALAAEREEKSVMQRPPRSPQEGIFSHGMGFHVIWVGMLMAAITLGTQFWYFHIHSAHWQTMVFTVLCLSQLANAMSNRSERESLFSQGIFSNKSLIAAILLTFCLQMAVIYIPVLNVIFNTQPLSPIELVAAILISTVVFWVVEAEKLFLRLLKK